MKYSARANLIILVVACVTATSFACTCLPRTFTEAYLAADSVVRAKVVSVTRYAPGCTGKDCLVPLNFAGDLLVEFSLRTKYKNCGPPTKKFFGKTRSQSAACGFPFQVGQFYMLNLPKPTFVRRLGEPTRFYVLSSCQFHRQFSSLSLNRKALLRLLANEPENKCVVADV